jgi:hypothetical protein
MGRARLGRLVVGTNIWGPRLKAMVLLKRATSVKTTRHQLYDKLREGFAEWLIFSSSTAPVLNVAMYV